MTRLWRTGTPIEAYTNPDSDLLAFTWNNAHPIDRDRSLARRPRLVGAAPLTCVLPAGTGRRLNHALRLYGAVQTPAHSALPSDLAL